MKRMHVHVSVNDLEASIKFYSTLFGSEPAVIKPDYAKWMLDDPRVNYAISKRGAPVGLNHLGIQVESSEELEEMDARLQELDTTVKEELGTACCYAKSDKYWVTDPQGVMWESYHTLDTIPVFGSGESKDSNCCVPVVMMPAKRISSTSCC